MNKVVIQQYIAYLKGMGLVKNQKDFALKIGYLSESAFSQAIKKSPLPDELIFKIKNIYPDFITWMNSNGVQQEKTKLTIADYKHTDGKFVESNRFPKEVIIITAKSGMNLQSHYYANELMEELEKRIIYIDHDAKGRYFEIEGEGDSMNDGSIDSILDGDKLLLREIPRIHWKSKFHINKWDFTFFHYDRGFITKRIKEHNVDTGDLLLESRNPDKTLYPDFWINLKECAVVCNVVEIRRQKGAYYSL